MYYYYQQGDPIMFSPLGKVLIHFGFATLLCVGQPAVGAPQSDKIPREVIEKAENDGSVLVLVGLKVPWQKEETLTAGAVQEQRQAIDAVQHEFLTELAGTQHKLIRQYEEIPGIALEVGRDALAVMEKSTRVTNVLLDRPVMASLKNSTPGTTIAATPATAGGRTTTSDKVAPEIFEQATNGGSVLVLVGLKAPWEPEGPMSEALVAAQRKAIAASQNYLLVELAGTRYRVTRLYQRIPGIALEVGSDALKVLSLSPAVTNVVEDRPPRSK
jgi:hypothetical protein